jgi:hypothetical protein
MALDKQQLSNALVAAFEAGLDATSGKPVAVAIADAIHAYVSAGEIDGVVVDVLNAAQQPIGTGTQSEAVTLK